MYFKNPCFQNSIFLELKCQKLQSADLPLNQKLMRARYKNLILLEFGNRPHYAYALFQAAEQAIALGHKTISVIEFGVAGGNGMVSLEKHTAMISSFLDIQFQIYGFDTGEGLPELTGYKDVMHQWKKGSFPMDVERLKKRLSRSTLVFGNVRDTVQDFYTKYKPAPVGAIFFDLDLYSSTKDALKIFDTASENMLPRTRCYFDDLLGNEVSLTNEYMGEKLAISEYNAKSEARKITPVHHLQGKTYRRKWYLKAYVHHIFDHPNYNDFIANPYQVTLLRT